MKGNSQLCQSLGERRHTTTQEGEFTITMIMASPLRFAEQKAPCDLPCSTGGKQGRIVSDAQVAAKPDQLFQ